jgi:hypothetical protein
MHPPRRNPLREKPTWMKPPLRREAHGAEEVIAATEEEEIRSVTLSAVMLAAVIYTERRDQRL